MCDWTREVYGTVNWGIRSTREFQENLAAGKLCSLSRKWSSPAGGAFGPQLTSLMLRCPRTSQALNFKELEAHPPNESGRNSELADPCLESQSSQANFQTGETPLSSKHPPLLQAEGETSL